MRRELREHKKISENKMEKRRFIVQKYLWREKRIYRSVQKRKMRNKIKSVWIWIAGRRL